MVVNYHLQKKLLIEVSQSGLSWVHDQGYVWFHDIFMPTLEKAASSLLIPKETLSECYYLAGDVTEINDAPKKALEYYHKALNFDPDCGATYREIATMLDRVGKFDEALEYFNKAIALDPDDIYALSGREDTLEDIACGESVPLYEQSDVLWNVCEHLANTNHAKALAIVKNMNDVIGLRGKSYCYGALDEADKYLETWSALTQLSDKISLECADWFYMPEYIFDSPQIWNILLSSKTEFSGFGTFFDSLQNSSSYRALNDNEVMRLSFQYYKYTTSKNHEALKQLSKTYPKWIELKAHLPP